MQRADVFVGTRADARAIFYFLQARPPARCIKVRGGPADGRAGGRAGFRGKRGRARGWFLAQARPPSRCIVN